MLCLVCEKKIPLARQLAGSPFCSREHGAQHTLHKQVKAGPTPAKFAHSLPACALLEAQPDNTAFRTPIPRFCDVILCRRHLKLRYTIGVPSAGEVRWSPRAAPPGAGRAIGGGPEGWNRLQLGVEYPSPLDAARRLAIATLEQSVQAAPASSALVQSVVNAGFRPTPWDASFRKRWPGAHWKPAGLRNAVAFGDFGFRMSDLGSVDCASERLLRNGNPKSEIRNPLFAVIPFPRQPAGLRALTTAFAPALKPGSINISLPASSGADPIRPRHRIKGPGSREFAPARVRVRPTGAAAETFLAADFLASALHLGFRPAPLTGALAGLLPPAALPLATYGGESVPPADSRSRPAPAVSASIAAAIRLPALEPTRTTFTPRTAFPIALQPRSLSTSSLAPADAGPIQTRERIKGPGSREFAPALVGPRPLGVAAETFLAADFLASALHLGFRPAPLTGALAGLLPPAALPLATYRGESVPPADSRSRPARAVSASIAAAIRLPALKPTRTTFTLRTALPPALQPRLLSASPLAPADAGPIQPRKRIKGPGSREFAPALVGPRPLGVAAETFLAADFPASPLHLGFRPAPLTGALEGLLPPAAVPLATYRGESVPPADSRSRPARAVSASIAAAIRLPALKPTRTTFTLSTAFPPALQPRLLSASPPASGDAGPIQPRERIKGPGSRELAPALVGPRPVGVAAETFLSADFLALPLHLEFRPAPLTGALEGLLPPAALPLANYSCESFAMADSASKFASPAAATITAAVLLPKLPPLSAVFGPVANPIAQLSPEFHLAPRSGPFDGAEAANALQALSGVAESFTLADMDRPRHNPEPIPPRPDLLLPASALKAIAAPSLHATVAQVADLRWAVRNPPPLTLAPEPFQYSVPIPRELGKPDITELDVDRDDAVWSPAGFATEVSPSPFTGVFRSLYDSADFSLHPVWGTALITPSRGPAAVRLGRLRNPAAIGPAVRFSGAPKHAEGPGFSGILLLPARGAPEWEFGNMPIPSVVRPEAPSEPPAARNLWQDALELWRSVPVFARGLALVIPLIAPAMFYAPHIGPSSQGQMAAAIQARATVDLQEDFQAGLGAWTGPKGWESTWSITSPGAAQPGRLALYQPMVPLTDYRLELEGQIQAKSFGFAFRATDMNNYYAAKIAIRKPGPLPSVYLVRYAVIEGRPGPKTETVLPMYLRTDTLYDVIVTAQGDNFTITVNGQLVESWSDSRLKSGGVGLFAEKGEVAQIRAVHVTENVDFLGWLCSQVSRWNADRARIGVKHE